MISAPPFLMAPGADAAVVTPCREAATLFQPGERIDPSPRDAGHAKGLCNSCPFIAECLEWALDTGELYGVWGGTTAYERRALLRKRGKSSAG
ncbi:WhiB family transcriptional regulator [Streptomyces sp. NPDC001552]|uniref:WhiB family transcriptional regulator n=1 Tax=Streptomyces sp. NPDC001552 TaxID=3364587 RepID=UPI0036CC3129